MSVTATAAVKQPLDVAARIAAGWYTDGAEPVASMLARRLAVLLPPLYRERYETLRPVSMGSAGLRFDAEGRVAWEQMWGSFCNLALAGGPPHKGRLLSAPAPETLNDQCERTTAVAAEIVRGIGLAAALPAEPGKPGWVRVRCGSDTMAAWMLRAIAVENVAVRGEGSVLQLPAGPDFRLEKEIKNVITVTAKTAHYWKGHMPRAERTAVMKLLARMDAEQRLLVPGWYAAETTAQAQLRASVAARVTTLTGMQPARAAYPGWIGFACASVEDAVTLLRLVVVGNVLARREEEVLFLPLHERTDPQGNVAAQALWRARSVQ